MTGEKKPSARQGPSQVLGAAVGFLVAGILLLASIIFMRSDRPILWPPSPHGTTITVARVLAGAALPVAIFMIASLAAGLSAVLAGRHTWRGLGALGLQWLIALAIISGGVALSFNAFYLPWAEASAVYTVRSETTAKWRLVASADFLAGHWTNGRESFFESGEAVTPARQAAADYVFAARGDEAALARLVEVGRTLPAGSARGTGGETGIATQADVAWLLGRLTGRDFATIEEFETAAGPGLERVFREDGRWHLASEEADSR